MGSFGQYHWSECYWCGWWQQGNTYIIDSIGEILCDRCFDFSIDEGGGPYQPDAIRRAALHIEVVLQIPLPPHISLLIAEFLHEWFEP